MSGTTSDWDAACMSYRLESAARSMYQELRDAGAWYLDDKWDGRYEDIVDALGEAVDTLSDAVTAANGPARAGTRSVSGRLTTGPLEPVNNRRVVEVRLYSDVREETFEGSAAHVIVNGEEDVRQWAQWLALSLGHVIVALPNVQDLRREFHTTRPLVALRYPRGSELVHFQHGAEFVYAETVAEWWPGVYSADDCITDDVLMGAVSEWLRHVDECRDDSARGRVNVQGVVSLHGQTQHGGLLLSVASDERLPAVCALQVNRAPRIGMIHGITDARPKWSSEAHGLPLFDGVRVPDRVRPGGYSDADGVRLVDAPGLAVYL